MAKISRHALLVSSLLGIAVPTLAAPLNVQQFELARDPVLNTIVGGDSHKYVLDLSANETRTISIRQLGVDLKIDVGLEGETPTSSNSPGERNAIEYIYIAATEPSTYILTLQPRYTWWKTGNYVIDSSAAPASKSEIGLARMATHFGSGDNKRLEKVADILQTLVRNIENIALRERALATFYLADTHRMMNRHLDAEAEYRTAEELWAQAKDEEMRLAAKRGRALCLIELGRHDEAIEMYEQILSELPGIEHYFSPSDQLMVSSNICYALLEAQRLIAAKSCLESLTEDVQGSSDAEIRGLVTNNYGFLLLRLGDADLAIAHFHMAIAAYQETLAFAKIRTTHGNIGLAHRSAGRVSKAIEHYGIGIAMQRQYPDSRRHARILNNLGQLYASLRDYARAIDHFRTSIKYRIDGQDWKGLRATQHNLATALRETGSHAEALRIRKRLMDDAEIKLAPRERSIFLIGLARDYMASNETDKLAPIEHELVGLIDAIEEPRQRAEAQRALAEIVAGQGDVRRSLSVARDAEALFESSDYLPGLIDSKELVARLLYRAEEFEAAVQKSAEGILIAESMRSQLQMHSLGAHLTATVHDAYIIHIKSLLAYDSSQKGARKALAVIQRLKSRSLGDYRFKYAGALDALPDEELTRLRRLREQVSARSYAITELSGEKLSEDDMQELRVQYYAEIAELEILESTLAEKYSISSAPQIPFSVPHLQAKLGRDDVLLEYILTTDISYVLRVDQSGVHAIALPGYDRIASLAGIVSDSLRRPGTTDYKALRSLGSEVVVPALAGLNPRRLLVAGHRALGQVPFAVLHNDVVSAPYQPLIKSTQIINIPSAYIWLAGAGVGEVPGDFDLDLATFSDPVFSSHDRRVDVSVNQPGGRNSQPASDFIEETPLERLAWSRHEAKAAASGYDPGGVRHFYGFKANLEALQNPELGRVRRLHISTHGVADSLRADSTGMILSRRSPNGERVNGLLSVREILRSSLRAETVVLSGCETAIGPYRSGEGMQSLSNAFLKKGAQTVIASHWPVGERTTATFMADFYAAESRNVPASEALRQAQLSFLEKPGTSDPYLWGAFVNYGL